MDRKIIRWIEKLSDGYKSYPTDKKFIQWTEKISDGYKIYPDKFLKIGLNDPVSGKINH